jgi:hypothetical protein
VQNPKNPMYLLMYIKQKLVDDVKRRNFGWFYCHYEHLAVVAIVGMLVLKMVHPVIDPWT